MFTGLIQQIGTLDTYASSLSGSTLKISHSPWSEPLQHGESVAVQGVCLTVTHVAARSFSCDVLNETMRRTTLHRLQSGAAVNLERAVRPMDRLGGHFVSGHVDGMGQVVGVAQEGRDWILRVQWAAPQLVEIAEKGSVTLDGVSLTVVNVTADGFQVNLIPTTWNETSLSGLRVGMAVNIETDVLAKYVHRRMCMQKKQPPPCAGIADVMTKAGFL